MVQRNLVICAVPAAYMDTKGTRPVQFPSMADFMRLIEVSLCRATLATVVPKLEQGGRLFPATKWLRDSVGNIIQGVLDHVIVYFYSWNFPQGFNFSPNHLCVWLKFISVRFAKFASLQQGT